MRKPKWPSYRRFLKELREICPPIVPVKTRRRKLKDCIAYTTLHRNDEGLPTHFEITIDSRLSWEATWQVLPHEWAHCLAWNEDHPTVTDHDPQFGLAYSHVWEDVVE